MAQMVGTPNGHVADRAQAITPRHKYPCPLSAMITLVFFFSQSEPLYHATVIVYPPASWMWLCEITHILPCQGFKTFFKKRHQENEMSGKNA
jgi:hypothetical protein